MSKPASSGAKILRVGVIHEGKIIEERHIRHPDRVTVGQDAKNTFVIPASKLPPSFPVFDHRAGHYYLLFTDRMDGRVRNRRRGLGLRRLKSQGLAQKRGSVYALQLDDSAKGKVSLGEVTLLFQFVPPAAGADAHRAARRSSGARCGGASTTSSSPSSPPRCSSTSPARPASCSAPSRRTRT